MELLPARFSAPLKNGCKGFFFFGLFICVLHLTRFVYLCSASNKRVFKKKPIKIAF